MVAERVFDLHEQSTHSIMTGAERLAGCPVVEQKTHGPIKDPFLVEEIRESKRVQSYQRRPGIREICFRASPETELIAPPAAVAVLYVKKMTEGMSKPAIRIGGVDSMTRVYCALCRQSD